MVKHLKKFCFVLLCFALLNNKIGRIWESEIRVFFVENRTISFRDAHWVSGQGKGVDLKKV
jgi:hypothetical protein